MLLEHNSSALSHMREKKSGTINLDLSNLSIKIILCYLDPEFTLSYNKMMGTKFIFLCLQNNFKKTQYTYS